MQIIKTHTQFIYFQRQFNTPVEKFNNYENYWVFKT